MADGSCSLPRSLPLFFRFPARNLKLSQIHVQSTGISCWESVSLPVKRGWSGAPTSVAVTFLWTLYCCFSAFIQCMWQRFTNCICWAMLPLKHCFYNVLSPHPLVFFPSPAVSGEYQTDSCKLSTSFWSPDIWNIAWL